VVSHVEMAVPTKYLASRRPTNPFLAVAGFDGALDLSAIVHVWLMRGAV
jgi:hypothetical protein